MSGYRPPGPPLALPFPSACGKLLTASLVALLAVSCTHSGPVEEGPTRFSAAERVVAIGDLHGDLEAANNALRLSGAVDDEGRWIGGRLVVVQTGDILDRGDDELEILDLFDRLGEEARATGGSVHVLNGNHELMNAYQDFRYITEGGFADFQDYPVPAEPDSALLALDPSQRGRAMAFRPGGELAKRLALHNTAVIVGSSVFVHGGIIPANVEMGLDRMNALIKSWLLGESPQPEWIRGENSPVWTRLYSSEPIPEACDTLASVLDRLEVERMVVGHTVQKTGITSFCGGQLWAIDVGMAAHYGGRPEVLEIRGDVVRGLR
jgi:hypothetical protein